MSFLKTLVNVGMNISNDYKIPAYKTVETHKAFEVRVYERTRFAMIKYITTDSEKLSEEVDTGKQKQPNDAVTKNVWKLMKYTQGNNEKNVNMKFLMPVFVFIEKLEGQEDQVEVKIMVGLPEEYQFGPKSEEPPKALEPDIEFEIVEQFKCYVKTFSGFAGDNEFKTETNKLRDIVKEKYKGQVSIHDNRTICIAYDPPYKLFNRRNEVMLIAK